ncbi:Synaptophysin isoform 1 [Schistosoma japonicum]|uniref:Synaptophysin isoform 1 n=1 Tax=Schistosoma japonicum TaxID=6182 RepID=A0A4Z2DGC2_SCHJA|nr:Synaptophysin isoform 1 [Schistosoma japonicum]
MMESSFSRWEIFKEPRGFIKVIQMLIAISAFATTCDFSTDVKLEFNCSNTSSWSAKFTYPFSINSILLPQCNAKEPKHMYGDYSSAAQFYVFTGVLTMLYCAGVCIYYAYFLDRYLTDSRFSKYIFGFTNVALWAAGLWFIWKETAWSGNNSLLGAENIASAADGSQM